MVLDYAGRGPTGRSPLCSLLVWRPPRALRRRRAGHAVEISRRLCERDSESRQLVGRRVVVLETFRLTGHRARRGGSSPSRC